MGLPTQIFVMSSRSELLSTFQASIYLANWDYTRSRENRGAHYDSSSLELIYNLTNPVADPIGISLYQEISGGRRVFESETKLIAQKNFGPLILAYNLTLEAEWEGEGLRERNGEIQQAFGASYELSPRVSVGAEMLHEILLPALAQLRGGKQFLYWPECFLSRQPLVRDNYRPRPNHPHRRRS